MIKRLLIALAILFLGLQLSYAQTQVILKSGRVVEGTEQERTEDYIVIDFNGVGLTFWYDDIQSIDGEMINTQEIAPVSYTEEVDEVPFQEEDSALLEEFMPGSAMMNVTAISAPQSVIAQTQSMPSRASQRDISADDALRMQSQALQASQKVGIFGLFMVFLLFGALPYAFFAYCQQRIAVKMGIDNAWLAWIPVGNIYLFCLMAEVPAWWLLLFFVPLANIIVSVIVFVKICQKLGKPGWLGILFLLPLVNFIVLGYLAWGGQIPKTEKNT